MIYSFIQFPDSTASLNITESINGFDYKFIEIKY